MRGTLLGGESGSFLLPRGAGKITGKLCLAPCEEPDISAAAMELPVGKSLPCASAPFAVVARGRGRIVMAPLTTWFRASFWRLTHAEIMSIEL